MKSNKTTREQLQRKRDHKLYDGFRDLVQRCGYLDDLFIYLRNDRAELWHTNHTRYKTHVPTMQCAVDYSEGSLKRLARIVDTYMLEQKRAVVKQYEAISGLIVELGWTLDLTMTDYAVLRFGPAPSQFVQLEWSAERVEQLMDSIAEAFIVLG